MQTAQGHRGSLHIHTLSCYGYHIHVTLVFLNRGLKCHKKFTCSYFIDVNKNSHYCNLPVANLDIFVEGQVLKTLNAIIYNYMWYMHCLEQAGGPQAQTKCNLVLLTLLIFVLASKINMKKYKKTKTITQLQNGL